MKVVAIALVLLQASLHSCRTYNTATPKNDTENSKPVKLPSKLIQILESLDTPDAKITKIKELIPVYNDFPEFRVKSNKKHLFMPYKKKGKPLAYILKKTYVNELVSEHSDESSDSIEVKNNENIYKTTPNKYSNKVYYASLLNKKILDKHGKSTYPKLSENKIVDSGEIDEPELKVNDNDQFNKNEHEIEKSLDVNEDDLKEPIIVVPEHKHVHHTHRYNVENSEETEIVPDSNKLSDISMAKHKESNHHQHAHQPVDLNFFQSKIKSEASEINSESNSEQIPTHSIPKANEVEKEFDQIIEVNVHKHHNHHSEPVVSLAAVNSDDINGVATKHEYHKIEFDEANVNPKHDFINHVAHHTEEPQNIVTINADELHSDKLTDFIHKFNLKSTIDTNTTQQKSSENDHPHSHTHKTHLHSDRKESVQDLDKYLSYLNDLDLISLKDNVENDLNPSNGLVTEATLVYTNSVSKKNNATNFGRIFPGTSKTIDSQSSEFSASEYYSDEFGSGNSTDDSISTESSSEFIDSVSDSHEFMPKHSESTETDEYSSLVSSESENTSEYSNESVSNDSKTYSESHSESNSKSLEFDSLLSSSQRESESVSYSSESNESDTSGLALPSEVSNLVSESVELSAESDLSLSDKSSASQSIDSVEPSESQSSELSNSGSNGSSEIASNSLSESDESDSKSDYSSKSDSEYLSHSESDESSDIDSVPIESILESSEIKLNSKEILAQTVSNNSNLISSASDLKYNETYLELSPTESGLVASIPSSLEVNAPNAEATASHLESSLSNLETVFRSGTTISNVESNASSLENSTVLETTALSNYSTMSEESTDSSLVPTFLEPQDIDLESVASDLESSASSLKSDASNLESFASSLKSVPGLESVASNLNTTASDLEHEALNLATSAIRLKWGSGLSTASNLESSTNEFNEKSGLSTEPSPILASTSDTNSSNLEILPSLESISKIIEKTPSSPSRFQAFYSRMQSSVDNVDVVKDDLCKDRPVIENKLSNGKKTYSMSFVFNK